jgi:hypothetical protein
MHARALTEAVETHSGVVPAVTDLKLRQQAAVLKSARVIGLTTTRAAMQRALLEQLAPGVVIVEEVKLTHCIIVYTISGHNMLALNGIPRSYSNTLCIYTHYHALQRP